MDENTIYTETGAVNISDDVIQTIAAMAVNDVAGATLPVSVADGFVEKLVKKNFSKGIKIEKNEKEVSIELHVLVDYGVKIQSIAAELQDAVKKNIETMTDLTVTTVDVHVEGIHFVKEPKKTEAPKTEE